MVKRTELFKISCDCMIGKPDFIEATNATIFKPYHLPFNPLTLTQSKVFKPLLPIHTANAFKDTLTKIYNLGPKQQDMLLQCINETYLAYGIKPADKDTWSKEAPTFEQVYQRYANDEDIKKNDSLAAAMNKLHQFEVFEGNPSETKSLFELLQGVVVIDLSGYDADIQSLIVDRDYMSDLEVDEYREKVLNAADYCFVTKNVDVESYFISAEYLHDRYGDKLTVEEATELISKATATTKESSIEIFINSRIDIANKNRNKEPEKRVNAGKVARECRESYELDPVRYRHGKRTFKAIKSVLQDKKLPLIDLVSDSEFLCDDELALIFSETKEGMN